MPGLTVNVRAFGAVPDDGRDDTAAVQRALNSLSAGQWLVFPAGTYQHDSRLVVATAGVVLWSEGATLHATNPFDQAIELAADGAAIYNFTLTAVTGERLYAPWHSRIAIHGGLDRGTPLRDNVIQGNRIVNGGARGTALANSASSAGIYVDYADNFLVAGNEVRRSLSDGIHITGGARNGRVLFNTVRESGDDLIGVVSYLGDGDWTSETAARLTGTLAGKRDRQLVRDVLVAHNDVSGNYWGRGITVVGGADITVSNNRISQTAIGAGILLARDASFVTWGVNNVLLQDNTISQVQTLPPAYTPLGWDASVERTGHGAVEIYGFVFDDERAFADLVDATAMQNIRITRTTVTDAWASGVRVGVGTGVTEVLGGIDADGRPVTRQFTAGAMRRIELSSIAMSATATPALQILASTTSTDNIYCEGLTADARAATDAACGGARPVVSGTTQSCLR
jgi:polygalacturonase